MCYSKFDIIALPPDVDELIDEENFDEEMTTPSVKDLSDNVEMCVPMEEIEVKEHYESIDVNDDGSNSKKQMGSYFALFVETVITIVK
ncbi:uncharacterized protein TNCV_3022311 [Trichonephila clavipes]|nr:uncharacterized protein TNCV_3022311 [Trichonephila clavipes]